MGRISNAWSALMGRPIYDGIPPARLLELEPDDQILLECKSCLTPDQHRQINMLMKSWLAGDARVAVLSGGIRIVAVKKMQPSLKVEFPKEMASK